MLSLVFVDLDRFKKDVGSDGVKNVVEFEKRIGKRGQAIVEVVQYSLGGDIEAREDGFVVRGGNPLRAGVVSSREDHRIAMAAGVLALRVPGVTVTGSEAVKKSYPGFFGDLASLTESS